MTKRSILPLNAKALASMLGRLQTESDRGAALIAAAWVDDSLTEYVRSRFVEDGKAVKELLTGDVPLGTFSSRIKLAYCLGWIGPDVRADLNLIRSVRNEFAHSRGELSFSVPAIRNRCSILKTIEIYNRFAFQEVLEARDSYVMCTTLLASYFLGLVGADRRPPISRDDSHGLYIKHVTEHSDLLTIARKLGTI
jgi:DNA-binding MltR family transcriptional regulator